jgi:hypothetical protein
MRGIFVAALSIGLAALPMAVHAQQDGRVSTVALTGVRAKAEPNRDETALRKPGHEQNRSSRHAAKSTAKGKIKVSKKGEAPPRFNFEQRAARSFGPLSLTLPPDTQLERGHAQFNPRNDSAAADKNQLAVAPSDPGGDRITSAGIENLGMGHNVTVVVPLFQFLDKISNQQTPPAQE